MENRKEISTAAYGKFAIHAERVDSCPCADTAHDASLVESDWRLLVIR